jgi:hypothetical protein
MSQPDFGSARDEAQRLVTAALAMASRFAQGTDPHAGGAGPTMATGSAECCVCPICRTIAAMRDPDPDFADRLAAGAGDLAAGVASLLRSFGGGTATHRPGPAPDPGGDAWRAASTAPPATDESASPRAAPDASAPPRAAPEPPPPATDESFPPPAAPDPPPPASDASAPPRTAPDPPPPAPPTTDAPDPDLADRLAAGAGDLAAGLAGLLRSLGGAASQRPGPPPPAADEPGVPATPPGPGADAQPDADVWRAATTAPAAADVDTDAPAASPRAPHATAPAPQAPPPDTGGRDTQADPADIWRAATRTGDDVDRPAEGDVWSAATSARPTKPMARKAVKKAAPRTPPPDDDTSG